jgi:hypothetical protein
MIRLLHWYRSHTHQPNVLRFVFLDAQFAPGARRGEGV